MARKKIFIKSRNGCVVEIGEHQLIAKDYAGHRLDITAFHYLPDLGWPEPKSRIFVYRHRDGNILSHYIWLDDSSRLHIGCFSFSRANTEKILRWAERKDWIRK